MNHTATAPVGPSPVDPAMGAQLMSQALGAAPVMARLEARQEVHSMLGSEELDACVTKILDQRYKWRYRPRLVITVGFLVMALLTLFYIVLNNQFGITTHLAEQDAAQSRSEAEISALQQSLSASNIKLQAQGLPPVQAPLNPSPGSPEQAKLITAAATASTLASLPPTVLKDPRADDLGKAVADYVGTHSADIYGPLAQQVITQLAQYVADNKAQVTVAVPPTAAEITKAFTAALAANPQLLCPAGGTYGFRDLALVNGGSVASFGCYGNDSPAPTTAPPPTTTEAPPPTTTQAPPTTTDAPAPTTDAPAGG